MGASFGSHILPLPLSKQCSSGVWAGSTGAASGWQLLQWPTFLRWLQPLFCLPLTDWLSALPVRWALTCRLSHRTHLVILWRSKLIPSFPTPPHPNHLHPLAWSLLRIGCSPGQVSYEMAQAWQPSGVFTRLMEISGVCHANWLPQWHSTSQLHPVFPIYS